MNGRTKRVALLLVLLSFTVRIGAILFTEITGFNPFVGGQVPAHEARAAEFAAEFRRLEFDIDLTTTTASERWAPFLAVFWLLPGPSEWYARFGMVLLSTTGVVNVYLIASHYHSKKAGVLAALPIALLPSYVFMHGVVQREATILFLLTSAFILVFLPEKHIRKPTNYALAIGCVLLAGHLRLEMLPVYLAIVATVVAAAIFTSDQLSQSAKLGAGTTTAAVGVGVVYYLITNFLVGLSDVVDFFAETRARRARGRATYLESIIPTGFLDLIAFSWIGAIYFLFTPFPWHIEQAIDLGSVAESFVGIGYALFATLGALVLKERTPLGTLTLVTTIVFFAVLFGYGTANYGTAIRHRQTVFWAIFILGAIGFSSKVRFKL